jgi:hypothetical protein
MLAIQEGEDEKSRMGDEENFPGEIQGIPQADDFLAGNLGRKDIHNAHFGIMFILPHDPSSELRIPSENNWNFSPVQMFI